MLKITLRDKLYRLVSFITSKSIYTIYDLSTKWIEYIQDIIFNKELLIESSIVD